MEYSESSLIVTLFTRVNGIIAVIAKGAKRPKSKFGAYLVPGQVLEVVYHYKPTRSVQTLTDVSYSLKLSGFRTSVEKMALVITMLELSAQVLHENEVNERLFDFLKNALDWVDQQKSVTRTIFPYLQLRILDRIGIGLQIDQSFETKSPLKGYINIETGTLSNIRSGEESEELTGAQLDFIFSTLTQKKSSIFKKKLTGNELNSLIEYLDRYIRYHVEGVKPRRSDKIFEQLLSDQPNS